MLQLYASNQEYSRGRLVKENSSWHKSEFLRDRDRILNSASFRRLQYKTQVFLNNEGDHYRTRLTHSIEVAQIARSISRILGINEDLAEALALSHDIGHAPFGHAGEDALNFAMMNYGGFDHNAQTLKTLTDIENKYAGFKGLNLTWETLEGIVKHNGPLIGEYSNYKKKDISEFILKFSANYDLELNKFSSLEAQVASLSDDITYNNHDIEDGVRAGMIQLSELENFKPIKIIIDKIRETFPAIPQDILIHETIRKIKSLMINDLITTVKSNIIKYKIETVNDIRSLNTSIAHFSDEVEALTNDIRKLLKINVYNNYKVNRMTNKARRIVLELFDIYMNDPGCVPTHWKIKIDSCASKKEVADVIADYISGMTDRYATKEHMSFYDLSHNDSELQR